MFEHTAVGIYAVACSRLLYPLRCRQSLSAGATRQFAIRTGGRSILAGANVHLKGGLIFVIAKIWSRDVRQTLKSCAGVLIIGTTAAAAMAFIRLIGEQRLQRFLDRIIKFKRRPDADKVTAKTFIPNNQP